MLQNVKACAAAARWQQDRHAWPWIVLELERPILCVLEKPWLDVAKRTGEVAAKAPAGILVHGQQRANFVVAEAVDMEFLDVEAGTIDDKLANVVIPKCERKTASE